MPTTLRQQKRPVFVTLQERNTSPYEWMSVNCPNPMKSDIAVGEASTNGKQSDDKCWEMFV